MAAGVKQTLCVPGDETGPDPKLWLFCHRKEKGKRAALCVVAATSNSAGTVLCARDTHKVRITRATMASASSLPNSRLPPLSSALGGAVRTPVRGHPLGIWYSASASHPVPLISVISCLCPSSPAAPPPSSLMGLCLGRAVRTPCLLGLARETRSLRDVHWANLLHTNPSLPLPSCS